MRFDAGSGAELRPLMRTVSHTKMSQKRQTPRLMKNQVQLTENCPERGRRYAEGVRWLLHEAFCEDAQEAFFHAHEYFHSTVKEACETAERLGVKNLVLYHSEDVFLEERKRRYLAEGRQYFSGGLYVPDDLEVIELN